MLKKFISYYKPHKGLFALDMGVAVFASLLGILFPFFTRELLRTHIPEGNQRMITIILLVIFGVYVIKTICTYIRVRWGHILGVRMEADMRRDIFNHLQKLSFTYYDNVKTGHIMSRITNDLNMIAEVAHHAPEDLLISLVVILGAYGFMFSFSASLALISLIPLPIMVLWGLFYGGKMRSGFRLVRKKIADINSTVENSVQGIREVKSFSNEDVESEKFNSVNHIFRRAKERMYTIMARFFSGMQFLREFYYFTVIAGGAFLIGKGSVEVYDLVTFVLYVGIVLPPIDRLIQFTEQLQQGAAAFERFTEILDIEPDIQDKLKAADVSTLKGDIRLEHVTFRYSQDTPEVLRDVTVHIPAGTSAAVVGESGAGKSTLVSLIPRFYEVLQGSVTIDGIPVSHMTQRSLRKQIGLVQQNVFLFDDTIRENILYGRPDAADEEVIEAAQAANIHDFIMTLPDGYATEVGERGVKLSGGQKQRISIARVFLKDPSILIFDEATSSLDNESEALVQDAFERLTQDRTSIIIAHRLSTVKHVDTLHVMREGEIVESGSHDELLARDGYYKQLYQKNLM
ncbi:MAG: ABC transporter ATP-binding protein/permease [Spirochaetales bacterium]|nr:ABC transporter ATP-binding protein/permease [Spirochaetales bacterium]